MNIIPKYRCRTDSQPPLFMSEAGGETPSWGPTYLARQVDGGDGRVGRADTYISLAADRKV